MVSQGLHHRANWVLHIMLDSPVLVSRPLAIPCHFPLSDLVGYYPLLHSIEASKTFLRSVTDSVVEYREPLESGSKVKTPAGIQLDAP